MIAQYRRSTRPGAGAYDRNLCYNRKKIWFFNRIINKINAYFFLCAILKEQDPVSVNWLGFGFGDDNRMREAMGEEERVNYGQKYRDQKTM